jgi:hypothetical protein
LVVVVVEISIIVVTSIPTTASIRISTTRINDRVGLPSSSSSSPHTYICAIWTDTSSCLLFPHGVASIASERSTSTSPRETTSSSMVVISSSSSSAAASSYSSVGNFLH